MATDEETKWRLDQEYNSFKQKRVKGRIIQSEDEMLSIPVLREHY
jgi:hypothetical protein